MALTHFGNLLEQLLGQDQPRNAQFFHELGTDSAGTEGADHAAVSAHTAPDECEDILHGDDVAFHSCNFGKVDHAPRAVAHARDLNYDSYGRSDLLAHGLFRNVEIRHCHHGFETRQRVAAGIGVD